MSGLFGFLAFVAFVAFIVGLIKPQLMVFWSNKKTRGMACLYLVAMVVFSGIAGATSGGSAVQASSSSQAASSAAASQAAVSSSKAPASQAPVSSKTAEKPFSTELASGQYTAGIDIPAGTYNITAVKGSGNVSTTNMFDGGLNVVMGVGGGDMYEKEFKNAKLDDGVVLSISGVTVKIASVGNVNNDLKKRANPATKEVTLAAGNFVAGKDFPEGVYNVVAVKGSGNVSSDNMLDGGLNAIMGTKADDMYIKEFKNADFKSGVTLKISGVTVKLVPSK